MHRTIPQHTRRGGRHFAESLDRPFRPSFLYDPEHGVDDDDRQDGARIDPFPQKCRNHTGRQQHKYEKIRELGQQPLHQRTPRTIL